jgi:hypothetical protein
VCRGPDVVTLFVCLHVYYFVHFCAAHPPYNLVYALQVLENPTLLSNTRPAKPGSRSLGSSANTSSKGGCC